MRFFRFILIVLIACVPLSAYVPRQLLTSTGLAFERWSDTSFPIPWQLNMAKGANINGSRGLDALVRLAVQTWTSVPTAQVSFVEGVTTTVSEAALDRVNLISFAPANFSSGVASLTVLYSYTQTGTDPLGRKIEFPGQILEADILFNPSALFSTDESPAADRIDLQSQITHEIGHFLGLDHSGLAQAAMFPVMSPGTTHLRALSMDDQIGISMLYPVSTFWTARGGIRGSVRTPVGSPAFGANVVILDGAGRAVVSTLTEPDGNFFVQGLENGTYSSYAEPLDQPVGAAAIASFATAYPTSTVSTAFTTRFATVSAATSLSIIKTPAGEGQTAVAGDPLPNQLEVQVLNASNNPVAGVVVNFAAASGGGAVVPVKAVTDAQGKARTTAYVGRALNQWFIAAAGDSVVGFPAARRISISSVSPAFGPRNASVNVTIAGGPFIAGATTVAVSGTGVTAGSVNVVNPESLTATLTIAADAAPNERSVTVSTTSGTSNALAFTVFGGPVLSTIFPASMATNQQVPVSLTGIGFVAGATINIGGGGVTVQNIALTSSTAMTATFDTSSVIGSRTVSVTTSAGTSNDLSFRVFGPPGLSVMSPGGGIQGQSFSVTLTGTDLAPGETVVTVSGTGVTVGNVNVTSNTTATAFLTIAADAEPTARTVNVTTPGGTTSSSVTFTVLTNPVVNTITPAFGVEATSVAVAMSGRGFDGVVAVTVSGTGVTVTQLNVTGPGAMTATLVIAAGAATGNRDVTLTSNGRPSNAITFRVDPLPAPTLSTIFPASMATNQLVPVSLTGTGFVPGSTTINVGGGGVTVLNIALTGSTAMTATFDTSSVIGSRTVSVTTPGGTTSDLTFRVFGPPGLSVMSPGGGIQGQSFAVTLTGTGFAQGETTVTVSGTGVTVTNVNVTSDTSATASLTIAADAEPTVRTVNVTTPGGTTSSSVTFAVLTNPVVNTVTPAFGAQAASVPIAMSGRGFDGVVAVTVSGTGVTVTQPNVTGPGALTATLVIAAAATTGNRDVTLTSNGRPSNAVTFRVDPAPVPTLATILPASMGTNQQVPVSLTGTGFIPGGTSLSIGGGGVAVQNIALTSSTSMTATLDTTNVIGSRTVSVVTAGGTSNQLTFNVFGPPGLGGAGPTSGTPGQSFQMFVSGSDFVVGETDVLIDGAGVSVSNVVVNGATTLTAQITIAADAAPGTRNIRVRTPGGTSGNALTFTIQAPVPTVQSASPAFGVVGTTYTVTINGTGFVAGQTTLQFGFCTAVCNLASEITHGAINVTSTKSLTTTLTIDQSASIGSWVIWLSTPGGDPDGLYFDVINQPTLSSISPSAWYQGGSIMTTLTGTNFAVGGTTVSAGSGVTISNVNVSSRTSLTATFTIDVAAATGNREVRITTPAGTSGPVTFRIDPRPAAPTLSSASVSSGAQGAFVPVTLTGTNFIVGGTGVTVTGTGVIVSSVTGSTTTSVNANLVLSAAAGSYSIAVVTPGGTSNALAFTIDPGAVSGAVHFSGTYQAGSIGGPGSTDHTGVAARFNGPEQVWGDGTNLYIADTLNHTIRKMVIATQVVTTVAGLAGSSGSTDGVGSAARFKSPRGIWGDATHLYVTDDNHTIRRIVLATGEVTTFAGAAGVSGSTDGSGVTAKFNLPKHLWGDGTNLYLADSGNFTIRKVVITGAIVSTFAGTAGDSAFTPVDGTGPAAKFWTPHGVWGSGGNLYVTQTNGAVRKIVITSQAVTTVSGSTSFSDSRGIWVDSSNTTLYVVEPGNHIVRKLPTVGGTATLVAGGQGISGSTNAVGSGARFNSPQGIWGDGTYLYVTDTGNQTIRRVAIANGDTTTRAGTAPASGSTNATGLAARFKSPSAVWSNGPDVYVVDNGNNTIRKIVMQTGAVTLLAGTVGSSFGSADGTGAAAQFHLPKGIWGDGTYLYVTDGANTIRRIVASTGAVTTPFGTAFQAGSTDATGNSARFNEPAGIWGDGTNLYVADTLNHTIRKIVIASGAVTTLVGSAGTAGWVDGTGTSAWFDRPSGIWGDGTNLFVADTNNHMIRKVVIATGVVTTLAGSSGFSGVVDGTGANARFANPYGVWGDGPNLYVTDSSGHTIRKIVIATGQVTTLAGSKIGSSDGFDGTAAFNAPQGISGDGANIYVADSANHTIRALVPASLPAPGLSSISPSSGARGTTIALVLAGSSFVNGITSVSVDDSNITVGPVTVTGPGTAMVSLTIPSGAATGTKNVSVTVGGVTSNFATFTVN